MNKANVKPKRALLAYCALAEKLQTPGVGIMQALIPFIREACQQFSGQLFDSGALSKALEEWYGIRIPKLAVLGLAEQLHQQGVLTIAHGHGSTTVYQYPKFEVAAENHSEEPVSEAEVEAVLASFEKYCKDDSRLKTLSTDALHAAFLDRLLNVDSMRLLVRREVSIATKKTSGTLLLKRSAPPEVSDGVELHLDFIVSQFLLDLRNENALAFERVSNVAFANMAAEAIASFREPPVGDKNLSSLVVYLDSPLLLDMLGVNAEYTDYGKELLDAIKKSGARPAAFDHCITEAEAAVRAQLEYLRSGINHMAMKWGTSATPDLLAALVGNVGDRAFSRLGIEIHSDPEINLHRRSATTVGDIESEMVRRMQAWKNEEAKEYDRKSVWALLAKRDTSVSCPRICDAASIMLTRNTPLVSIANSAWTAWLHGTSSHSNTIIDRWAPIAMSDKQFAGYLWARTGGGASSISRARLLAHCSAAVRPRADVKARAYNLILELSGKEEADDIAALFEDREAARALMRASHGDPEDVTRERLPFILERVKVAAGEFAAAAERELAEQKIARIKVEHEAVLNRDKAAAEAERIALDARIREAEQRRLQADQTEASLIKQIEALRAASEEQAKAELARKLEILRKGFQTGCRTYRLVRWAVAMTFGLVSGGVAYFSSVQPLISAVLSVFVGVLGFWFVPDHLDGPLARVAKWRMRRGIKALDDLIEIPESDPNFRNETWTALDEIQVSLA